MISVKRGVALALAGPLGLTGCSGQQGAVLSNLSDVIGYEREFDRYSQVDTTTTDIVARTHADGRDATVLSAFYGLDDGMPRLIGRVACRDADGQDGLPVVFSHEVDPDTIEPGDFRLVTASGAPGEVVCLTMAPADDPGELRTALLTGDFGGADDQPVTLEIVGDVLSLDRSANFRGAHVAVTPLEDGPTIVRAERVPRDAWTLGAEGTPLPWGGGTSCPVGTAQVVRVTWAGGVSRPDGGSLEEVGPPMYRVVVERASGAGEAVTPVALADLNDGDNNHELCLDVEDPAVSVSVPAGRLVDPNDDLNPTTEIAVAD